MKALHNGIILNAVLRCLHATFLQGAPRPQHPLQQGPLVAGDVHV
jgi:hypothetical protein